MIQQQNKQQDNKFLIKTEEALKASFVMPAIRTMADDLAEANNPTSISVPISVSPSTTSNSAGSERVLTYPPTRPVANNIARTNKPELKKNIVLAPDQLKTNNGKSVGISVFAGVLVSLVLCAALWAGWTYWPRKNATIVDKIPSETLAFISFRRGAMTSEKILPKILDQLKVSENSLGNQWNDLVYGILPGSTSSETISFLLLAGEEKIDLSGTDMTAKKLANGVTAIVDNTVAGRMDGLSGKTLGENVEFRNLLSQASESSEYLYIKQEQLAPIVKAFTYLSPNTNYPVLISLSSGGENMLAISGVKGTGTELVKKQVAWDKLLKPIPAEILSLAGGADLSKSFDSWRVAQSNDPKMQEFLNGLNDQGKVLEKIRADLTGAYVAGSLSSAGLLPDGVAVAEVKEGAVEDLKTQMTSLEVALTKLGSMIGGGSYTDATFADGNYKDVPIRFVNFGDSSHSFDYAIVDSTLLVSNSKNSMQKMIDVYKGSADSFVGAISAKDQIQTNWQYILFSPDTLANLSAPLQTFLSGFSSFYIESTGAKTFSGSIAF